LQASAKQKKAWELIGGGIGVHWEAIDEDISVASLLQPEKFIRMAHPVVNSPPVRASSRRPRIPVARKGSAHRRA